MRAITSLYISLVFSVLGNDTCPPDYVIHNNTCYYFSSNKDNWNTAKNTCESHGSNLSSIADDQEVTFLIQEAPSPKRYTYADIIIIITILLYYQNNCSIYHQINMIYNYTRNSGNCMLK